MEPIFKIGDQITYKNKEDCPNKAYLWGGTDQGGFIGKVTGVNEYNKERQCYVIYVTTSERTNYIMLEDEFLEYDEIKKRQSPQDSSKHDYTIIRETQCGLLVAGPKDDVSYCSRCLYTGQICSGSTDRRKICNEKTSYYFIRSASVIKQVKESPTIPSEFPWGFDTPGRTYQLNGFFYVLKKIDKSDETLQFEIIATEDGLIDTEWFSLKDMATRPLIPHPKTSIWLENFKTKTIIITEPTDPDDPDYQPYLDKLWKIFKKNSLKPIVGCEEEEEERVYNTVWNYTQIHQGEFCKIDDLGENLDSDVLLESTIYLSYKDIIELDLGESIPETTKNPCDEVSLPTTMNDWKRKFYEKFQCNHQFIKDFIEFLGEDRCLEFIKLYDFDFSTHEATNYFKETPPESWLVDAFDWEDWDYWNTVDDEWNVFISNEYDIDVSLCLPENSFLPIPDSDTLQSCILEEQPQPIQQQITPNKLQFKF